ncbi:exonuclease SbcCD subunit D [Cryptosporangium arvum]|uniref:Nuclease SbcCD subunit D n=1 Tax=Cryptosporangium arvum DSM 44712 TaxID=927661 RepID=A0A010YL91_9ACTN|nr:exonuclease SbcCD subunit D [Cryptosporangium arvum]EXG81005.1 Exodeoxyribonuclease I subunit D [Cryptosporangium arvum DSM 44712]
MKFLHTSDWHVGKVLKGRNRLDEQRAVLREIVGLARTHEVDAVLVAGDLYDSAAPSAEAQELVVRALMALRDTGAEVIAIAGNHDHPRTFDAYRPLMNIAGITMVGSVRTAESGGVVSFTAPHTGEPVKLAVLPFLSQRHAVKAAELVAKTPAENSAGYDQLIRDLLNTLTAGFGDDAVNLVTAHLTVTGGALGGGERAAQSIFEYHVPAGAFPADAHYVALGHLHRRQTLPAACPVVYSGAPIAVDFGEQDNTPTVCLVEATPSTPARTTDLPLTSAKRLRTLHGTIAELGERAAEHAEDYLRVVVREPARAGLREEVQAILPGALEVRIDPEFAAPLQTTRPDRRDDQSGPAELFAEFLTERKIVDERVQSLFTRLHDEVTTG